MRNRNTRVSDKTRVTVFFSVLGTLIVLLFIWSMSANRHVSNVQQPKPKALSSPNLIHNAIASMDQSEKQSFFTLFLDESGFKCEASDVFFQGFTESWEAFWNIRCSSGSAYAVSIYNDTDGNTKILECGFFERTGLGVPCFTHFSDHASSKEKNVDDIYQKLKREEKLISEQLITQSLAWLEKQDKEHFTIQIAAASDFAMAQNIIDATIELEGLKIIRSRSYLILIYGSFPNRAIAKRTLESLPDSMQNFGLWIRSIGSIRDSL